MELNLYLLLALLIALLVIGYLLDVYKRQGKTFEMVGAAMEAKRLGLCQKSVFVVPNHLTEQWASEFLRLYPSANILVTTKKDFEKDVYKRQPFP